MELVPQQSDCCPGASELPGMLVVEIGYRGEGMGVWGIGVGVLQAKTLSEFCLAEARAT